MPLTEPVALNTRLQKGNRIQIPRLIRWKYQLEPNQILKVTVNLSIDSRNVRTFHARMGKDGRIAIPKATIKLLEENPEGWHSYTDLPGDILTVVLEP